MKKAKQATSMVQSPLKTGFGEEENSGFVKHSSVLFGNVDALSDVKWWEITLSIIMDIKSKSINVF